MKQELEETERRLRSNKMAIVEEKGQKERNETDKMSAKETDSETRATNTSVQGSKITEAQWREWSHRTSKAKRKWAATERRWSEREHKKNKVTRSNNETDGVVYLGSTTYGNAVVEMSTTQDADGTAVTKTPTTRSWQATSSSTIRKL